MGAPARGVTILNPPRPRPASPIQTTGPFAVQSSETVLSDAEYQRVTSPGHRSSKAWNKKPRRLCLVDDNPEPMTVDEASERTGLARHTIYHALDPRKKANGGVTHGHRFAWTDLFRKVA